MNFVCGYNIAVLKLIPVSFHMINDNFGPRKPHLGAVHMINDRESHT